jgi:hypothetical protein
MNRRVQIALAFAGVIVIALVLYAVVRDGSPKPSAETRVS